MSDQNEIAGDRGVIHPMHPAIVDSLTVDAGKALKAGTVLKSGASGAQPAAEADTPAYVLVEDVDTRAGAKPALCMRHGTAVTARLIDASGATEVPATAVLTGKLPSAGIFPVQNFDTTKMV